MPNESIHWNHHYSSCHYPYSVMGYRSVTRPLLSLSPRLFNYRTAMVVHWFDSSGSSSSKPQHHGNSTNGLLHRVFDCRRILRPPTHSAWHDKRLVLSHLIWRLLEATRILRTHRQCTYRERLFRYNWGAISGLSRCILWLRRHGGRGGSRLTRWRLN